MSTNAEKFDAWIRADFVAINTELEEMYFAQHQREKVVNVGEGLKRRLEEEGRALVAALLDEGNTDEGFDRAFDLLGNLGLYMAALRRHELTNPDREETSPHREASALGMQIGASVGLNPRFATAHLATHNRAINGQAKCFTSLGDEKLFLDYNTRGIFAFMRAADGLNRIAPLGVSHPVALTLFNDAERALQDVFAFNEELFEKLDVDRFFYSVRPYYKPYRVGRHVYRGANAGDFSGINEIDLLLGLCDARDPYYSQLLLDKMLFMRPEDQASLRDCMRRRSLLDQFLDVADAYKTQDWFRANATAFLRVCKAHGSAAAQHHNQLVDRFIARPADNMAEESKAQLSASGPPLPVLMRALEHLRDLRLAADRPDIATSFGKISKLAKAAAFDF